MTEEVRVWLSGTECELRPLSARTYIQKVSEAAQVNEALSGDESTSRLALAACLLAEGAFCDDNKMFSSGMEVLERLTAQEIMEAGGGYLIEQDRSTELSERLPEAGLKASSGGEVEPELNKKAFEGDEGQQKTPDRGAATESLSGKLAVNRAVRNFDDFEAAYTGGYRRYVQGTPKTAAARADMREISDFFERDSRRYGPALRDG
ncbi:MAG: hypothetical protein ACI3VB_05060 [Oscillospiraceae bacterium]